MAVSLLFSLFLLLAGSHAAVASVKETCAKATAGEKGHKDLASFCVASLQAAPGSAVADARGLAVIATKLTLANYTAAVATIKELQWIGGWTEGERAALATCRQRYIEAQNVVHSAIHALATGNKQAYVADMRVVRSAATDCEDAFNGGGGNGSPLLRKVDEDAVKLATVSMLIVLAL